MAEKGMKMASMVSGIILGGIFVFLTFLWEDILGFLNIDPSTLTDQIVQLLFWAGIIMIAVLMWALILRKDPDRKLIVGAVGINLVVLFLGIPKLYEALGWDMSDLMVNALNAGFWGGVVLMIVSLAMYIVKAKNK